MWKTAVKGKNHQGSARLSSEELSRSPLIDILISTTGEGNTALVSKDSPELKIHKALLAHVSPELHKQVNHDGVLSISEVDTGTIERFLEWAYTSTYHTLGSEYLSSGNNEVNVSSLDIWPTSILVNRPLKKLSPEVVCQLQRDPELLAHAKLYVFGYRFSIPKLRALAIQKLQAELETIVQVTLPEKRFREGYHPNGEQNVEWSGWKIFNTELVRDLVDLIRYCFENISADSKWKRPDDFWAYEYEVTTKPKTMETQNDGPIRTSVNERLLDYLVRFCAWQWDLLQKYHVFTEYLFTHSKGCEFQQVFFGNLLPAGTPPNRTKASRSELQLEHPLNRFCTYCRRTSIPIIRCSGCDWMDGELSLTNSKAFVKEYEASVISRLRRLPQLTSARGAENHTWSPDPEGAPQYMCPMPKTSCPLGEDWQNLDQNQMSCRYCDAKDLVQWEFNENMTIVPLIESMSSVAIGNSTGRSQLCN